MSDKERTTSALSEIIDYTYRSQIKSHIRIDEMDFRDVESNLIRLETVKNVIRYLKTHLKTQDKIGVTHSNVEIAYNLLIGYYDEMFETLDSERERIKERIDKMRERLLEHDNKYKKKSENI